MRLTIVTGASRGLGAALADALLEPGQRLICLARSPLPELEQRAKDQGCALDLLRVDLADPAAAASVLENHLSHIAGGGIVEARLINNAGTAVPVGPADRFSMAEIAQSVHSVAVNLAAPIALSAAFLRATGDWSADRKILNISSGAAHTAYPGWSVYCATKAGLDQFSRCVALEQRDLARGARIVSLAPGVIDTDMQTSIRAAAPGDFPAQPRFLALKASGQLVAPASAALRILAYMERSDFGARTVADLRDAD